MGLHRHFVSWGTVLTFSDVTDFLMLEEMFKKEFGLNQHMKVKPRVSNWYFSISV